jgi:hypothetical protein
VGCRKISNASSTWFRMPSVGLLRVSADHSAISSGRSWAHSPRLRTAEKGLGRPAFTGQLQPLTVSFDELIQFGNRPNVKHRSLSPIRPQ